MALTDKLTAIADGFRESRGTSDKYTLEQMAEMAAEPVGGSVDLKITSAYCLFDSGARLDYMDTIISLISEDCTDFKSMFYKCQSLTSIPELNTSNGTTFTGMFQLCSKLTSVPELDTSNSTACNTMFSNCQSLTTVPELDTGKCTNLSYIFQSCGKLTSVPKLDLNKCTNTTGIVIDCKSLENLYLYNIRRSIQIGSGTSWGHLLTVDSLVHTIKELCTVTSSQTLTMASASLEKISGLYCKIIDSTNEKKTMQLCESTDEGAMTLIDYAAEKGWQLA